MLMTRGRGGSYGDIVAHPQDLQRRGPPQGYFLDLTKIILVLAPCSVARAEALFQGMDMKVVTGSLYLGGFIGDHGDEAIWLEEKVQG